MTTTMTMAMEMTGTRTMKVTISQVFPDDMEVVEEPDFLLIMTMKMTTTLSSHQLVPTKPCNFQKNQSMEYHSTLETSFNN